MVSVKMFNVVQAPLFLLNFLMDSVLKQNMIKRDVLPDLINNHQQI